MMKKVAVVIAIGVLGLAVLWHTVQAGSGYVYSHRILACSGVATLTAAADSVAISCSHATADSTKSLVLFNVLNSPKLVGTIFRNYQINGLVEFESTGNETADIYIHYDIVKIAE